MNKMGGINVGWNRFGGIHHAFGAHLNVSATCGASTCPRCVCWHACIHVYTYTVFDDEIVIYFVECDIIYACINVYGIIHIHIMYIYIYT